MARLDSKTFPLLLLSAFALLQLPSQVADALYSPSSPVLQLTASNFRSKVVDSNRVVLVEFFAPWCGHCQALTPIWEKAATVLKGVATVAALDADAHKALAQEYGIKGFPTIKVFSPGKPPADYQGARDVKPIAEFALKQSLMSRFSVQGFPTILVFGSDKENPYPYEGARTASAIESFALEQREISIPPPEVHELTGQDAMESKCASAAICFVAFLPDILDSKAEGRNKYVSLLLSVAEKFKRSPYSYLWTAAGKQQDFENQVGVGGYGYPALVALNAKKGVYAPLRSAFELDQIVEFVKEVGRGGKGNLPLNNAPTIISTEPWDGKDGAILEEDEFSLEDLMGEEGMDRAEL